MRDLKRRRESRSDILWHVRTRKGSRVLWSESESEATSEGDEQRQGGEGGVRETEQRGSSVRGHRGEGSAGGKSVAAVADGGREDDGTSRWR